MTTTAIRETLRAERDRLTEKREALAARAADAQRALQAALDAAAEDPAALKRVTSARGESDALGAAVGRLDERLAALNTEIAPLERAHEDRRRRAALRAELDEMAACLRRLIAAREAAAADLRQFITGALGAALAGRRELHERQRAFADAVYRRAKQTGHDLNPWSVVTDLAAEGADLSVLTTSVPGYVNPWQGRHHLTDLPSVGDTVTAQLFEVIEGRVRLDG